jgi:hypothetical protein
MKHNIKESDIVRDCLDVLNVRHIFHYRNTGAAKITDTRFIRFGAVGSSDIICVIDGRFVGIEVKRPAGKVSPAQRVWHEQCVMAGGIVAVVHSAEELLEVLEKI